MASTTPSGFVTGQKRPHSTIINSHVPKTQRDGSSHVKTSGLTTPAADRQIKAAKKFDKYIEYDFSQMTDTKGGFLSSVDDPHNKAMKVLDTEEKPANMTMKEWERHQLLRKLREAKAGQFEPSISALRAKDKDGKKCRECGSLEIDWQWDELLKCQICSACKEKLPDKYSLLTKSEAREDYLLTNPELEDENLLPHLEKPNPHKSHWHNMQLFLRFQVEEYAFSDRKWGSPEALDAEFERRETEKKKRKEKKFSTKLAELKKRTMVEAHKRRMKGQGGADVEFGDKLWSSNDKHEHEWGRAVEDPETGMTKKKCVECGMEVEELEF